VKDYLGVYLSSISWTRKFRDGIQYLQYWGNNLKAPGNWSGSRHMRPGAAPGARDIADRQSILGIAKTVDSKGIEFREG
jgi:hypothetical protein